MFSIFWWALFGLFAIKVYHLYYKQQFNIAFSNVSWKTDIDPQIVDWYIKNANRYGSISWLIKLATIPYILFCTSSGLFPYFFGQGLALDFFHLIIISIPVCIAFIILYKARKLNDVYRIRNETFYEATIIFVALVIYTIIFCVGHVQSFTNDHNDSIRLEWTLYSFLCDWAAIAMTIIPTSYPVYLIKTNQLLVVNCETDVSDTDFNNDTAAIVDSMYLVISD
eukprot:1541_1